MDLPLMASGEQLVVLPTGNQPVLIVTAFWRRRYGNIDRIALGRLENDFKASFSSDYRKIMLLRISHLPSSGLRHTQGDSLALITSPYTYLLTSPQTSD